MTIERAKQIMANYDLNFPEVNKKLFVYGEVAEAFDMAIASLEAWEKVRQEVKQEIESNWGFERIGEENILAIIDKHLQELESSNDL